MKQISVTINGRKVEALVQPRTHLGDFLREQLRLTGTHLGCEHGVCGACTVLVDGLPVRSCIVYAVACHGQQVRTIEGFGDDPVMNELRIAFKRDHGVQCGFCTAGMLIAARDIVLRLPGIDESRIRRELSGNLCRCTGYIGIIDAVKSVVDKQSAEGIAPAAPVGRISVEKGRESTGVVAPPAASTGSAAAAVVQQIAEPKTAADVSTRAGWTKFSESFVINDTVQRAWEILSDFPLVVSCIPGAELIEHDDRRVKGRLTVRIGPMRATFTGSADIEIDPNASTGRIRGAGSDAGSGSRTKADAIYAVTATETGKGVRVSLSVEYNLQGALAQFSRSGLAQEVGRRLIKQFSDNLNARLTNSDVASAPLAPAPLNAGSLLWSTIRSRLRTALGLTS